MDEFLTRVLILIFIKKSHEKIAIPNDIYYYQLNIYFKSKIIS